MKLAKHRKLDSTVTLGLSLKPNPSAGPASDDGRDDAVTGDPSAISDRFVLGQLHATGGIGQVWQARDIAMSRFVALKELRPDLAGDEKAAAHFRREAIITGQLDHPGVVPIYELGDRSDTQQPFYTMRFVRGRMLSEASRLYHERRQLDIAEPLELIQLLTAFVTVCNTIAYAHSRGVIHRDIKGDNVLLGEFGEVVVVDWGLAKLNPVDAASEPTSWSAVSMEDFAVEVVPIGVVGTPAYMSPEQAAGRDDLMDHRTDVYGLGAILYEILTGVPPFAGSKLSDIVRKIQFDRPRPPSKVCPGVPEELERICLRSLEKSPEDRFESASDLADAIQSWLAELAEEPLKKMAASRRHAHTALRKVRQQQQALIDLIRCQTLSSPTLEQTFHHLTEVAANTLKVERVGIWRYKPDHEAIVCADLYQRSKNKHSDGIELTAAAYPAYFRALANDDVVVAHNAHADQRTKEFDMGYLQMFGIQSMLDTPIHLYGELDGVVCLEHVGRPRHWTDEEQLFAIALSNLVSVAIERWTRQHAECSGDASVQAAGP